MKAMMAAMAAAAASTGGALAQCPGELVRPPVLWSFGQYGRSVEITGDVAIAADPSDHTFCPRFTCSSGAVHVFRREAGAWAFEATIFHSRISEYDVFGGAITLDGRDRFAATAGGEDVAAGDTGAVYLFEHDGSAWREVAEVVPVEPVYLSGFGSSLALRGDTLVVGQPKYNVAYIYREIDGRWEFSQKIEPPDPTPGARFSNALALDGEWLVIGARLDEEMGHHAGAVYLYKREGASSYEFVAKLVAPGDPLNQLFGADVDIDGDRMIVGASNGPVDALGAVYVFEREGADWRHAETLRHDDPVFQDALGAAVSLRGDTVVAGAPRQDAAYVFRREPQGSWRQAAKLVPEGRTSDFGRAVATDGVSAIVGAPDETVGSGTLSGAAHIFDLGCLLCRADLDGDGELTFFDFITFGNLFAAGDMTADFDGSGALDFFDFLAFQTAFAAGCD